MGSKKNTKTALRRQIENSNSKTGRGHPTQIQFDNYHHYQNFINSRSKSPRPTKNKANNIRKMKKKTNNKKFNNNKRKIFIDNRGKKGLINENLDVDNLEDLRQTIANDSNQNDLRKSLRSNKSKNRPISPHDLRSQLAQNPPNFESRPKNNKHMKNTAKPISISPQKQKKNLQKLSQLSKLGKIKNHSNLEKHKNLPAMVLPGVTTENETEINKTNKPDNNNDNNKTNNNNDDKSPKTLKNSMKKSHSEQYLKRQSELKLLKDLKKHRANVSTIIEIASDSEEQGQNENENKSNSTTIVDFLEIFFL